MQAHGDHYSFEKKVTNKEIYILYVKNYKNVILWLIFYYKFCCTRQWTNPKDTQSTKIVCFAINALLKAKYTSLKRKTYSQCHKYSHNAVLEMAIIQDISHLSVYLECEQNICWKLKVTTQMSNEEFHCLTVKPRSKYNEDLFYYKIVK